VPPEPPPARLAELVAALSLGIDLGFAQPMEHVLRQCLIALRLADGIGLDDGARAAVYYTALLVNVGCHSDAHEQAKWMGDDIALKATKYEYEPGSLRETVAMMRRLGGGGTPLHRLRAGIDFVVHGRQEVDGMIAAHARLARTLGEQLGLPPPVLDALAGSYEYWDGKGFPGLLSGADVPIASRVAQLAEFVEVAHRTGGTEAALDVARRRSGTQFDPGLVAYLEQHAAAVLGGLDGLDSWRAVIDAEPALTMRLDSAQLDDALLAIANFVDIKSPYTLGHSRALADLVVGASAVAGLSAGDTQQLRRAALVHGYGRLGVSNTIWDKVGPLGPCEWERVRMHPYFTERMLQQSESLAPLGRIAVQVRERMDGSGYPRGLRGGAISMPARILGAADAYQAMREPRPHRPALDGQEAGRELQAEARQGRLDAAAVDAVLRAAGHRVRRRTEGPAGLTAREVEVLKLVAGGLSNREIAERLFISRKTAGNHIEHIYAKINTTNRAGASLFASQHGLLPEDA
jgi:HD-GYP domain-containing protein (c-di-GMP phosphodiesterase class II)